MSNGLVKDVQLSSGKPWSLGDYVRELGGAQVTGKRTLGICIPFDEEEDEGELSGVETEVW